VLLDHGFYCDLTENFRKDFCDIWLYLITMDYNNVRRVAKHLGIGEYYRYLPLLFTYRTINAKKPLGSTVTPEEKAFLMNNDEVNFEKISFLL
jgi:aarF domain-containing kinase